MAAMSLMLDASDFQPRSGQGVVWRVKWMPSTTVSVVNSSVAGAAAHAAVSSPVSTSRRNPWAAPLSGPRRPRVTIPFSRSIRPNSPRSLICMAPRFAGNRVESREKRC